MKRRLEDALKRLLFRLYKLGSRLGVHVMPAHYYVAAADIIELQRTRDQWQRKSDLPGLTIDLDQQLSTLRNVCLPFDYQRNVLKTFMHWSKTSLFRAYLAHNSRVAILFCLSHLHYEHREQLQEVFPDYDPAPDDNGLNIETVRPFEQPRNHFPSSIYLETR